MALQCVLRVVVVVVVVVVVLVVVVVVVYLVASTPCVLRVVVVVVVFVVVVAVVGNLLLEFWRVSGPAVVSEPLGILPLWRIVPPCPGG